MVGKIALETIDKNAKLVCDLSKKIWDNPEGPFQEYKACQWQAEVLEKEGFTVEVGVGGVPTALKASYGSGHPVIGFLGEYDALPGLSQKLCTHPEPEVEGGYGHACGHNLLGTGHLAAAIGIKEEMKANNLPGTIVYFGCPAEEVLTGKVFMARGGAFDGVDFCISWHPGNTTFVTTGSFTALNSFKLHFTGVSSHAGGAPHEGRSALDAIELTNVGINYLREHVPTDVRMNYVIENGGTAPNIVPDKASAWYMVRATKRETVVDVYERMLKVARGAAMMTDTKLEIEFLGGCYAELKNQTLVKLMHECMLAAPQPVWTDEEKQWAKEINECNPSQYADAIRRNNLPEGTQIFEGVMPIQHFNTFGASDVGDVTYLCAGISCFSVTAPLSTIGHSWQNTFASGSSIGQKGMLYAAKFLALWSLRLMTEPEIANEALEEHRKATEGKPYVCPIPAEIPVPYTK